MNNIQPVQWSDDQLLADARLSESLFRDERLRSKDEWTRHVEAARPKFAALLACLASHPYGLPTPDNLKADPNLAQGDALRYLAGPPISEDDLEVVSNVSSLEDALSGKDQAALNRILEVLRAILDPHRFPWVVSGRAPEPGQLEAARLASTLLMASRTLETERRMEGKSSQETKLKEYLLQIGFVETPTKPISSTMHGPGLGQFCGETTLGERKADVVLRLPDTRLMAIECKVSNSAINSVKRLNNDAAAKAVYWVKEFGRSGVVPAALLSGVFKVLNLRQAQEKNLALFWSHDLDRLRAFIESTRENKGSPAPKPRVSVRRPKKARISPS